VVGVQGGVKVFVVFVEAVFGSEDGGGGVLGFVGGFVTGRGEILFAFVAH